MGVVLAVNVKAVEGCVGVVLTVNVKVVESWNMSNACALNRS